MSRFISFAPSERTREMLTELTELLGGDDANTVTIAVAVLHSVHFATAQHSPESAAYISSDQAFEMRRQQKIKRLADHARALTPNPNPPPAPIQEKLPGPDVDATCPPTLAVNES